MSSRRSSLSVPVGAPPPYSRAGSAPPSFRSSPPSSQGGDDDDSIQGAPDVYTSPRKSFEKAKLKPSKLSKPKPLEPIVEKTEPVQRNAADVEPARAPPPAPKFVFGDICSGNVFVCCTGKRNPWCLAAILVLILLVGTAIVLGAILPHAIG